MSKTLQTPSAVSPVIWTPWGLQPAARPSARWLARRDDATKTRRPAEKKANSDLSRRPTAA